MKLPRFGKQDDDKDSASDKVPFIDHEPADDDRYMNLSTSVHNWQVAFRLIAALLAVSIGFNGYYMMQSKFIPVLVPVDI